MFDGSPDLHNDLSLGPAFSKVRKRLLRLIERKHLVNHRPDAPCLEEFADLCELAAIWMHEQKGILDATFPGVANYLAAQQPKHEHHEKVHAPATGECGVGWSDERDNVAIGLQNPK